MSKQYLTVKEVCEITNLSKQTIYTEVYKRSIPFVKFGPRLLRFDREQIENWMENRVYKPLSQAVQERKAERTHAEAVS
jgi:excisionase family DNA binding protein